MMGNIRNKQVGTINYAPASIKIPLIFDNRDMIFRATYAGTKFEHVNARDLETTVLAAITSSLQVTWQGIITIEPFNQSAYNESLNETILGFEIQRSFVAQFPTIGFKTVHWGCPEESRTQVSSPFPWHETTDGPFLLPRARKHHAQTTYYHPYSEILWNHLHELQGHLRQMRMNLLDALQTEEGITTLIASGFLTLLPTEQKG